MSTVILGGSASGVPVNSSGDFGTSLIVSGNNTEDGLVTSSSASFAWTNATHGIPPFDTTITWNSPGIPASGSGTGDIAGGSFNTPSGAFAHGGEHFAGKPSAVGDTFDAGLSGSGGPFFEGTAAFTISVTLNYVQVRLDSADPAVLDPAGGQVVTIHGAGFLGATVGGDTGSPKPMAVTSIRVTGGGSEAIVTDFTILSDVALTFIAPPIPDPGTLTYAIVVAYGRTAFPGEETLFFPLNNVNLEVSYTGGVTSTWWHNPTSNHYVYAPESPGAPFVASDPPTPTITGFSPRST